MAAAMVDFGCKIALAVLEALADLDGFACGMVEAEKARTMPFCEVVVKMRLKRVWTLVVVKGWTDQSDTSAREDETEKRDSNVNAEGGTTMHDEWDRQWYQRLDVVSRKQGLNR